MSAASSPMADGGASRLPSLQSFGDLSNFLRGAIADEEGRQLADSMGTLALHVDAIVAGLRLSRERDSMAPLLVDLLAALRQHRLAVQQLAMPWQALYEHAAYLQALANLRAALAGWLLQADRADAELPVDADAFSHMAWRTLGEGALLLDMHEQGLRGPGGASPPGAEAPTEPLLHTPLPWWRRLSA